MSLKRHTAHLLRLIVSCWDVKLSVWSSVWSFQQRRLWKATLSRRFLTLQRHRLLQENVCFAVWCRLKSKPREQITRTSGTDNLRLVILCINRTFCSAADLQISYFEASLNTSHTVSIRELLTSSAKGRFMFRYTWITTINTSHHNISAALCARIVLFPKRASYHTLTDVPASNASRRMKRLTFLRLTTCKQPLSFFKGGLFLVCLNARISSGAPLIVLSDNPAADGDGWSDTSWLPPFHPRVLEGGHR